MNSVPSTVFTANVEDAVQELAALTESVLRRHGRQIVEKQFATRRLADVAIDFHGKVALGQMHQGVDVNGATDVLRPDGSMTIFQGGLLALRSNIGRYQRDELAFMPELGLDVGLQLTRHLKLYAGYSFLWINTVARAGEQIDPVINVTQFPILSGAGPLVGPARPAFNFNGTDFWAQGLNFGLELRY